MLDEFSWDALIMIRDGLDILQPDTDEADTLRRGLLERIEREIDARRPHIREEQR